MAEFNLWLLIVGVAVGAAITWLIIGTIARSDDEVAAAERQGEARWITETIEDHGGRAPTDLVEQILFLHRRYLQGRAGQVMTEEEQPAAAEEVPTGADEGPVPAEADVIGPTETDAAAGEQTTDAETSGKATIADRRR